MLGARDLANVAYDAAKAAGRMARAKDAHDAVIAAVYRAQADALLIEGRAKARLADEYDAAQERGEVRTRADNQLLPGEKKLAAPELGLSHKDVHEARRIRDAEKAEPGVTERTLESILYAGDEPTRAELRHAVFAGIEEARKGGKRKPKNPLHKPDPLGDRVLHLSDLCAQIVDVRHEFAAVAGWDKREFTARQLRENVRRAHAALETFIADHDGD